MTLDEILLTPALRGITERFPYAMEYFGLWSIYDPALQSLVDRLNGMDLTTHRAVPIRAATPSAEEPVLSVTSDGIAVFQMRGPMMKIRSSMSDNLSTVELRKQFRQAASDPKVLGGLLVSDTPGGTSAGNADLAADVRAFAAAKPLYAVIEDMTASAGVSIISQATKRFATNAGAMYGAMGTYAVIQDLSSRAEQLGLKVHVVKAGEFKGMGTPGTKVTDEQLAEMGRMVIAANESYLAVIAQGLGKPIDHIRALADGRIHSATVAHSMGLIDGVQSQDETYRQLLAAVASKRPTKTDSTATRNSAMEPKSATLAELKAQFPKSSAEWREAQMEAGATLAQASLNYVQFVEAKAEAREKELQAEIAAAKKPSTKANVLGFEPLTETGKGRHETTADSGDPVEDFDLAVQQMQGRNPRMSRDDAVAAVARRQPDLHRAFLLATNPGAQRQRMLAEKNDRYAKA